MATAGIIQRRDNKSNLINGTPSGLYSGANWSGTVQTGEFVYAIDTKEVGFLDSTDTLVWRFIDDFGAGGDPSFVFKGSDNPNDLPSFGEIGDNYMRQYEKTKTNEYILHVQFQDLSPQ